MYPDEFDKYINNLNQNKTNITKWEEYINYENYSYDWKKDHKPTIAIIYAVGGIISGESNPGPIGSTLMGDITIKKAIKEARENDDIDAIVLRIDSGGGSALASDMIWREIYKTTTEDKKNKKPFIVSMSDVAASGGYYIACEADKIVANETSVTGSIGVVYLRINFSQLLNRIGINTESIKRGENADFATNSRLFSDKEEDIVIESILDIYNTFKQKVIDGRANLNDINELDEIALGRVWSGKEAKENGLIDEIGGLHDAINITKESIGITSDSEVEIIEYPKVKEFNLFDFFISEDEKSEITEINLDNLFPEEISNKLKALDIVPIIMNDEIQLLVPYNIQIN
jgi:protease-4